MTFQAKFYFYKDYCAVDFCNYLINEIIKFTPYKITKFSFNSSKYKKLTKDCIPKLSKSLSGYPTFLKGDIYLKDDKRNVEISLLNKNQKLLTIDYKIIFKTHADRNQFFKNVSNINDCVYGFLESEEHFNKLHFKKEFNEATKGYSESFEDMSLWYGLPEIYHMNFFCDEINKQLSENIKIQNFLEIEVGDIQMRNQIKEQLGLKYFSCYKSRDAKKINQDIIFLNKLRNEIFSINRRTIPRIYNNNQCINLKKIESFLKILESVINPRNKYNNSTIEKLIKSIEFEQISEEEKKLKKGCIFLIFLKLHFECEITSDFNLKFVVVGMDNDLNYFVNPFKTIELVENNQNILQDLLIEISFLNKGILL